MSLRLLRAVAEKANRADTFTDAAASSLAEICEEQGWIAGHLCMLDETGRTVISTPTWYLADPVRHARLQRMLEGKAVIRSIGVAARAWAEGEVAWAVDLSAPEAGSQAEEARVLGVKGACAFPIVSEHRISAVLEFFSADQLVVDDELASLLADIAGLLSRVIEREQAAQRILDSEDRTRRIIATARDAYVAMNVDGVIVGWNQAAEETFGWPADEAIGTRLERLIIPERYRDAHRKGLLRFLFTGQSAVMDRSLELFGLRRDGTEFPIELSIWAVEENDWTFNAFVRDISARKEAERAIRENEERFRLMQEHAPIGVALVDLDGSWLQVNPALCELVGYTADQLLRGGKFQDITHPEDLEPDLALVRSLLAGEIRSYHLEKRYVRSDGDLVWINLSVALVRHENGDPKYFISQILDITERKQTEDALKQANHELNARAADLERAHEALADFASVAAHDLGGPLQVMTGFAELVATRYGSVLDDQGQEWLEQIQRAGYRGKDLIGDLLAYARVGRSESAPTSVELRAVAEQAVQEVFEILEASGVLEPKVHVDIQDLPVVVGEERQLRQLFVHLVDNAVKFSGRGDRPATVIIDVCTGTRPGAGGDVDGEADGAGVDGAGGETIVRVTDNGLGIPPDARERVFGMFEQLDPDARSAVSGTGMGLALCKRIVERHGGAIWIEEPDGSGTRICFSLPSVAG